MHILSKVGIGLLVIAALLTIIFSVLWFVPNLIDDEGLNVGVLILGILVGLSLGAIGAVGLMLQDKYGEHKVKPKKYTQLNKKI